MGSEEELKGTVRQLLANGPKSISDLAGCGLGKTFNQVFHGGSKKNNGSFKKWLATVEGVEVEESANWGGRYCIKLSHQSAVTADATTRSGQKRKTVAPALPQAAKKPNFPSQVGQFLRPFSAKMALGSVKGGKTMTGTQANAADRNALMQRMMPAMMLAWAATAGSKGKKTPGASPAAGGKRKTAPTASPVAAGKRKTAPIASPVAAKKQKVSAPPADANLCWDFMRNECKNGANCPFDHTATSAVLEAKAHEGSHIKGRTDDAKEADRAIYATWAEERLEKGTDSTGSRAVALDWWYSQVCLCCLKECDWHCYVSSHMHGTPHKKKFIQDGGYTLKPGVLRPDPSLEHPLETGTIPRFTSCAGFARSKVLTLGEQDYSFSLSIARLQVSTSQDAQLVATSYLAAHDPDEPEVHVRDDGMRAHYSRKSLPAMEGALQKNIDEARSLGVVVLHGIDATNLPGTLLPLCSATYDLIVFPFPRASLMRGVVPKNPMLLRNFFRSVNDARILEPEGRIGLVLLRSQYAEWDTACVALEAGFHLVDQATLPDGFYQGREMSGKIFDSWKSIGAEIYIFQKDFGTAELPVQQAEASERQPPQQSEEASGELRDGWEEHWSEEHGIPFYWNAITEESLWDPPVK